MFTRRIVCFFVVAVFLGGNTIAENAIAQDNDGVEARRPEQGFRLVRPKPWVETQQSAAGALHFAISPEDAAGRIQLSIITKPIDTGEIEPKQARDIALKTTNGKSEFSDIENREHEIVGRMAPGFKLIWNTAGETFHLQQYYLVENDFLYTVSFHCPADQFPELEPLFAQVCLTIELVPINEATLNKIQLEKLAARCGSELKWATDWKTASAKAKAEHKAVLVFIRQQSGFDIADAVSIGPLMDSDIVALIGERCVPFRFQKGMEAPFVSHDVYGISASSFGSTILLVNADGTVIGDTFTNEPVSFEEFLLKSLEQHVESKEVQPPTGIHGFEFAQWLARRGELDRALNEIGEGETFEDHLLKAKIFRRQRQKDQALDQIVLGNKAAGSGFHPKTALEQAYLRLRMGQFVTARNELQEIADSNNAGESLPETLFWLGSVHLRMGSKTKAEEIWTRLIEAYEENRWAWKAAAYLSNPTFDIGAGERLQWPSEDSLDALNTHPFEKLPVTELIRAENEAIEYLLQNQRSDGSWISPSDGLGMNSHTVNPLTTAITGICGRSLLGYSDRPEAIAAAKRAIDFLITSRKYEKAAGAKAYYMDYSPWSHAYVLSFLVASSQAGIVERESLESPIADLIADLKESRKPGGGWSYYVTMTLANAGQPENQSISFMTAAIVMALLDAQDAGFDVPAELLDPALTCLERMRHPNTTFDYFLWHDREGKNTGLPHEGAAGRGPLCSLALYRGNRGSVDEIRSCLDIFMEHRGVYAREKGKTLMHASPGGEGSHYLMFDYAWTAAAISQLPVDEQAPYRTAILQQVLDARSANGSYVDNPIIGRHYATGMALSVFQYFHDGPEGK